MDIYSDERKLVEGVNARENGAFEKLFHLYYRSLCFFSNKFIRNEETTRDIVQEVYARLFERKEYVFTNLPSLRSFLYSSVHNESVDWVRRKNKLDSIKQELQPGYLPEPAFAELESRVFDEIFRAIDELPMQSRRIFIMSYIDHESVRDIAIRLNIAETTVKTQRQRAKAFLRERLKHLYVIASLLFW